MYTEIEEIRAGVWDERIAAEAAAQEAAIAANTVTVPPPPPSPKRSNNRSRSRTAITVEPPIVSVTDEDPDISNVADRLTDQAAKELKEEQIDDPSSAALPEATMSKKAATRKGKRGKATNLKVQVEQPVEEEVEEDTPLASTSAVADIQEDPEDEVEVLPTSKRSADKSGLNSMRLRSTLTFGETGADKKRKRNETPATDGESSAPVTATDRSKKRVKTEEPAPTNARDGISASASPAPNTPFGK